MKAKDLRYLRDKYFEEESYADAMEKSIDLANECAAELTFDDVFKKGLCHIKLDENEGAVDTFTKALEMEPGNALALTNKGLGLYNLGRVPEAFAAFAQALKLKPDNYPAWHYLALHFLKKYYDTRGAAEKEKLVNALRHILAIDPEMEALPVYDPVDGRELGMGEFVLLNSNMMELSVDEMTEP